MHKISKFLNRYKYLLTIAVFLLIIFFLDNHSYVNRKSLELVNDSLRQQIAYYEAICTRDSMRLHNIQNDPDAVVRVAREDYLMKSENEDVYIIIE